MFSISRLLISKTLNKAIKSHIFYNNAVIKHVYSNDNKPIEIKIKPSQQQQMKSQWMCQLQNYEKYLVKHNLSIKKPHQRLQKEEQRIIHKYLSQKKYEQIISFLLRNASRALCHEDTSSSIDQSIAKEWKHIPEQLKIVSVYSLLNFRENKSYDILKTEIFDKIQKKGVQNIQPEELFIIIYGQLINHKNVQSLTAALQQKYNKRQLINLLYTTLKNSKENKIYHEDKKRILSYFSLLLESSLNKIEDKLNKNKKRSLLQITVESFLQSLNLDFQRQMKVNDFFVDYIIYNKDGPQEKPYIIEVYGNYHYTLSGQLKGKEIIRNLIVNQYGALRIIHCKDFLQSKGHRNKMAYINNLFQMQEINWESENQGMNSQWYVQVDDVLLKQLKS